MLIYYAHCVALYDTPQEERDEKLLECLGFEVYNPNCPEAAASYEKEGMPWFFKKVRQCDALAFRALPDGAIPAGVFGEVEAALDADKPVFELPSMLLSRGLTAEETREYLHDIGQR